MSRKKKGVTVKHPSLKYQLINRFKELDRLHKSRNAEKNEQVHLAKEMGKEKVNRFNVKTVGVHSFKTGDQYWSIAHRFINWVHERGYNKVYKTLDSVPSWLGEKYLRNLLDNGKNEKGDPYSATTLKNYMTGLNKVFKFRLTGESVGLPIVSKYKIFRSRNKTNEKMSPAMYFKYKDEIMMAKATGCREHELIALQYRDFTFNDKNECIKVKIFQGKGGKQREVHVLKDYQGELGEFLIKYKNHLGSIFGEHGKKYANSQFDNHSFRAEYCFERYKELMRDEGYKYNNNSLKQNGFFVGILQSLTRDMGHNRTEVMITNYLDRYSAEEIT